MKNKAYFKNVEMIGDLYLDYVFFEFECEPILFSCVDEEKNIYFCLCSEIRKEKKWVVIKTTKKELEDLVWERVDIVSAFLKRERLTIITINLKQEEHSFVVEKDSVDRLDLPKDGIFVRCDQKAALDYLKEIDDKVSYEMSIKDTLLISNPFMKHYTGGGGILKNNIAAEPVKSSGNIEIGYFVGSAKKYGGDVDGSNNITRAA